MPPSNTDSTRENLMAAIPPVVSALSGVVREKARLKSGLAVDCYLCRRPNETG
jgi:hypothetical protein